MNNFNNVEMIYHEKSTLHISIYPLKQDITCYALNELILNDPIKLIATSVKAELESMLRQQMLNTTFLKGFPYTTTNSYITLIYNSKL